MIPAGLKSKFSLTISTSLASSSLPVPKVCTLIDVDEVKQIVRIKNYADNIMFRAFGSNQNPDIDDYREFLESRCFPRTRDKMKLVLKDIGVPFYDPYLIIQKTEGRMAEDDFWIRIEK